MSNIYNRTDEEFSVIGEVPDNFIANDPLYKQGFQAGAASRDAEIADLKAIVGMNLETYQKAASVLRNERDQLRAAMQEFIDRVDRDEVRSTRTYNKFKELLK